MFHRPELINKLANHVRDLGNSCAFTLARNSSLIPMEVSILCEYIVLVLVVTWFVFQAAPDNDPRKKKLRNNMKRKKNKDKKKQQNQSS